MAHEPSAPSAERREHLLGMLADLVARGGAGPLLAPPVMPGDRAFPEHWKPTRGGVSALLRRLAWHAGTLGERTMIVDDDRLGAPPTEHKPQTRVELTEVRQRALVFTIAVVGNDDVAGTLAHEIGVAHAALHRPEDADPYRTADAPVIEIDPDRDLERGSIATVYLGLGVLAANAAYQQYSGAARVDAYSPLVYEVHRAGYAKMSDLAYLLAVQAAVRGDTAPPPGLAPPQRDEVAAWIEVFAARSPDLRARVGIGTDARSEARPAVVPFEDVDVDDDGARARRIAFRWHTHRGWLGLAIGLVIGVAASFLLATRWVGIAGTLVGHLMGRRIQAVRCSACATVVGAGATTCRKCGVTLRGDIARLSDRLEAEERLEHDAHPELEARPEPSGAPHREV